ncbi:MAG: nucleotidyltransferase family protein [Syntrophales bacterium]
MGTIAYLKPYELQSLNDLKQSLHLDFQLIDLRLYGSKARGTADADSDIDVMIELEELPPTLYEKVFDLIFDVNLRHGVFISAVLFGRKELEDGPMSASPLFKAIEREGVRL